MSPNRAADPIKTTRTPLPKGKLIMTTRLITIVLLSTIAISTAVRSADPKPSFSTIIRQETRSTFRKVANYVTSNPQAPDANLAWKWLFTTAIEQRIEDEAIPFAETYLKSEKPDPLVKAMAQQALIFGLARSGKADDAVELFESQLRFARLQNGREIADFGTQLATTLRVSGHFDASKKVFEATANKFFLDGDLRAMCENKIAKLNLLNKPAPSIDAIDTKGVSIGLSDYKGKLIVIDFWATNCAPCIDEFPNLKAIYTDLKADGVEIIGISLDGDAALVDAFSSRYQLPWRMITTDASVEEFRKKYHVRKIPSLYVVNQSGDVVQYDIRGTDLRETLQKLLQK